MKKIQLAVIGYGGMGGWHTRHALESDVVELRGIYDILPEKRALAESRGIYAYGSFEEVLADPAVELVTVAIPNDQHESVCIRGEEEQLVTHPQMMRVMRVIEAAFTSAEEDRVVTCQI